MRTLLATVIVLGGLLAQIAATEASECEQAQNEDPAGQFAGYPCWAQETFGRGTGSGGGE